MDAIRIQIIRGCDANGQGGTVVDDASGVLGSLPDDTPILDALAAAFVDQYGLYSYDNHAFDPEQPESETNPRVVTVSAIRNISTQLRIFGQEVLKAYVAQLAEAQAKAAATQQAAEAIGSLTIVENLP